MLDRYKNGDQQLVEELKKYNQAKYHDLIDKEFAKFDIYRKLS